MCARAAWVLPCCQAGSDAGVALLLSCNAVGLLMLRHHLQCVCSLRVSRARARRSCWTKNVMLSAFYTAIIVTLCVLLTRPSASPSYPSSYSPPIYDDIILSPPTPSLYYPPTSPTSAFYPRGQASPGSSSRPLNSPPNSSYRPAPSATGSISRPLQPVPMRPIPSFPPSPFTPSRGRLR